MARISAFFFLLLCLAACHPGREKTRPASWLAQRPAPEVQPIAFGEVVTIDAFLSRRQAIDADFIPKRFRLAMRRLPVLYWGTDSSTHFGQLVCHKQLCNNLRGIFAKLRRRHFPIESVKPVALFNWSDKASMRANNTSCFNYRKVEGQTRLSQHAFGAAIDINPLFNPHIHPHKEPVKGSSYQPKRPGTLREDSEAYQIFLRNGWYWGGKWQHSKDYMHFYVPGFRSL